MKDRIGKLFDAIDKKDADTFVSFLTQDASFRFANAPAVIGRENIHKSVSGFFSAVGSLEHQIKDVWESGGVVVCEGDVTYTRHDKRKMSFPFVNILRAKDGFISDYRIYIDSSTLFA